MPQPLPCRRSGAALACATLRLMQSVWERRLGYRPIADPSIGFVERPRGGLAPFRTGPSTVPDGARPVMPARMKCSRPTHIHVHCADGHFQEDLGRWHRAPAKLPRPVGAARSAGGVSARRNSRHAYMICSHRATCMRNVVSREGAQCVGEMPPDAGAARVRWRERRNTAQKRPYSGIGRWLGSTATGIAAAGRHRPSRHCMHPLSKSCIHSCIALLRCLNNPIARQKLRP